MWTLQYNSTKIDCFETICRYYYIPDCSQQYVVIIVLQYEKSDCTQTICGHYNLKKKTTTTKQKKNRLCKNNNYKVIMKYQTTPKLYVALWYNNMNFIKKTKGLLIFIQRGD